MVDASIRVLVVDDHPLVASALAQTLASMGHIKIVGVANSVEDLELLCRRQPECPDVAIIDYQLTDGTGIEAASLLQQQCPSARSVLISATSSPSRLRDALDAGCVAYVNKASRLEDLVRAVEAAFRGEATFDAVALHSMLRTETDSETAAGSYSLSRREAQILAMLAGGAATEVIASQLCLSLHTVRNHVRNLTAKLGAHSRLEAVSIAARAGILTLVRVPQSGEQ